jgi:H+/Cl- antiporter ClcA
MRSRSLSQKWGFEELVLYALWAIALLICLGCIYAFLRAIFLFIFSKWDEKQVKSAWSSIRYMIIWLFLTVLLLFAAPSFLRFMHVQGAEKYTPKNVIAYMGKILSWIGGLWNVIKESQEDNKYNWELYYDLDSLDDSYL